MHAACDDDGNDYLMVESIVHYQNNDKAVIIADQKVVHPDRNSMWRSTVECQLCVQFRYGSTSCQSLRDLKELHQLETA